MAKKRKTARRRHAGRVTLKPCPRLGDDRMCEPLNAVVIQRPEHTEAYAACSCGRHFPIEHDWRNRLDAVLSEWVAPGEPDAVADGAAREIFESELWPKNLTTQWSKIGVAPVGTPTLHRPAAWLAEPDGPAVHALSSHMLDVMLAAEGIGLAASQVAVPLRVFVHNLPRVAPRVLVNAELVWRSDELWEYQEGCLSLNVAGSRAIIRRPKEVTVAASLLDGGRMATHGNELFGRVLQHELDHLDGVEYVQRLAGSEQQAIYRTLGQAGVDVAWLPALVG